MPFQILSLSGGGFLGLYTVTILTDLENQLGRPISSSFDLLAGTSIGGIIALGLAAEIPASEIKTAFEKYGERIFSDRPAPKNRIEEWQDFFRSVFKSKYNGVALRETVSSILGENVLGDLKHPVIIPVVNLTKGTPQIFKTDHHPDFKLDYKLKAMDVALATSAAPTYFPIAEINDELFADGGLYANSPDLIALHEAEYFFEIPTAEIRVLSIGTTTSKFSFSHVGKRNLGSLGWSRKLPQTMISAQQLDIDFILKHKLKGNYLRIDVNPSKEQERDLGLDVATLEAQQTIRGLASSSFQAIVNDPILEKIIEHRAPRPKFYYKIRVSQSEEE